MNMTKEEKAAQTPEGRSPDQSVGKENKKEEAKIEVPAKFVDIVEAVEKMSVLDLSELVKVLEDKFGVSASQPMMMAAAGGGAAGDGADSEEEKTSFSVELQNTGDQKINVIRAVREITELALKDAKDLVDNAPKMVKEGVGKEEAENIKKKLEAAGAGAEIK